jgi:predicted DsbA family dithiol-disulfide isomerase
MSTVAVTVALNANTQPNPKKLLRYVKKSVVKNPDVIVKGVTVIESKTHEKLPGWTILLTNMDLEYQKKQIQAPEIMFIKDGLITGNLIDLKTGSNYRDNIKPTVPDSYYDDKHLLFGNKDAKHKILIFSDPQCPFCQEVVPKIFKASKENPATIAVYYYHLPLLRLHPVSDALTRIMYVAQHEGKTDVIEKLYTLKINHRERDLTKILAAVKAHAGYSVSAAKVNAKEAYEAIKADGVAAGKMMVTGTPTIYIDGEWDKMRYGFEKLIK